MAWFHLLSASSSLASLARASSTSAGVTEVDDDDDGIPQLSFAMSSDRVPQLSFAKFQKSPKFQKFVEVLDFTSCSP